MNPKFYSLYLLGLLLLAEAQDPAVYNTPSSPVGSDKTKDNSPTSPPKSSDDTSASSNVESLLPSLNSSTKVYDVLDGTSGLASFFALISPASKASKGLDGSLIAPIGQPGYLGSPDDIPPSSLSKIFDELALSPSQVTDILNLLSALKSLSPEDVQSIISEFVDNLSLSQEQEDELMKVLRYLKIV